MKKKLFFTLALFWCSLVSFGYTFSYSGILYTQNGPTTVAVANHSGSFSGQAIIYNSVYDGVNWYSVTNLEVGAFQNCTGLTSVTIPNSVTSIGTFAFSNCRFLTSVNIPNSVTIIGDNAFNACSSLTSITIPNSVTSITPNTFSNCIGLTSVSLPNSVISIGNAAFLGCSGLTSLNVPNSVTTIGVSSFQLCTGLTSVTIPNSVTSIGNGAFNYCSGLTSVIIPNSVTSIGIFTFQSCTGLTSVIIPNTVTSIGTSAFKSCTGLTSLSIPNSVTSIGSNAFQNCIGLTDVTVNWATPLTNIDSLAFSGVTLANVKLYVPAGTETEYDATAVWTNFNIIIPITATQSQTDVSCNGGSNGLASVVASGGTMPYTYLWSNGSNSATATGLTTGNYSCTITDATMVSIVKNFVITEPTQLTATQSQTDVSCFGGGNGTATVTPIGGTAPYTYFWTPNGSVSATATGLIAGDYFCIITDNNGCNITKSSTIIEPTAISLIAASKTNVSCYGGSNGSASIAPFGGTAPYTYLWNNGATSQSISGLTFGNYNVIVTDNKGCTASRGYVISQPNELTTSGSQNNVPCSGATIDTFATVTPSGGTAPYTYFWNNGASTQSISEIAAGNYFVTVTDQNGCSATQNFTITSSATPLPTRNTINGTLCEPSTYADLASKFDNSSTIKIYATATSTTPLNPQDIISPIGTNVTYYITQTLNGCESARLAYSAFVNTLPTPTAFDQTFCGTGYDVGDLVATLSPNSSSLKWYDLPTGGTQLNTNTVVYLVSGNYYVTQNKYPCGESARKMITVTISLPTDNVTTISACDSYTWNGQTYSKAGIYIGTTTNCVTEKLDLTITPSAENITTATACGVYMWNGTLYNESGTYTGTTTNCVTEKLNLTIVPNTYNFISITTCDSYIFNGETLTQSATYFGTADANCVTDVLTLTITPSYYNNTTRSACDSYTWANNNQTYTQSGTYYGTTTGCGTEKLNLTITPTPISDAPANVSNCFSYTLPALLPGNKYYSEANGQGIEYVVGANDGITQTSEIYVLARSPFFPFCQSQNSFTVTIIPNSGTNTVENACGSYIWVVNGETYTTSGIYEYVSGCNTSYLNLTINPITTTATNQSRCDSYYWAVSDAVYNQSGTYTYDVGCESFVLNLTITASSTNTITETACNSYTWNGQTYTASGIYEITTNCVTDQLNLTITPSTSNTTNVTAVGNYTWSSNNFNYTLPGNYSYVDGCDTQILNLTLIPATLSITNENGILTANTNAINTTFQWYDCGLEQNIAGQTSATFTPTQSGQYRAYMYINGVLSVQLGGCFNFTFLANNTFSGIAGLDIYPNPSNGIINLKLPTDLQVEIYNNLGQLLSSEKMFSGANIINISDKAAGVYFLKANDGNNMSTFKIIKN